MKPPGIDVAALEADLESGDLERVGPSMEIVGAMVQRLVQKAIETS